MVVDFLTEENNQIKRCERDTEPFHCSSSWSPQGLSNALQDISASHKSKGIDLYNKAHKKTHREVTRTDSDDGMQPNTTAKWVESAS